MTVDDQRDTSFSAAEKDALLSFLEWHQDVLPRKIEGLDDEQLTRRLVPSPTNLIGLVKHLAYVHRWWFEGCFLGGHMDEPPGYDPENDDWDYLLGPGESAADVVAVYRKHVVRSRQIVREHELDERARSTLEAHGLTWTDFTLRWIVLHMIEEIARHNGHADIVRELIDGATGE